MSNGTPATDAGSDLVETAKDQDRGANAPEGQAGDADDDASGIASDDPHKVEELAKAGRDSLDTDEHAE